MPRINQRLSGLYSLSYLGYDSYQPTDIQIKNRDPLTSDSKNYYLGTWWLNTNNNNLFYLASLSRGIALWINVASSMGAVNTLTGNSGGPISPLAGNINVIGDLTTISIAGNPGTSTLTVSATGFPFISTLTGNSGGAVPATANNINVVGSGNLSVAGNPSTHTLTISQSGAVAISFLTQSGTAVPAAGVLTVNGANGLSTSGAGNTVTVTPGSTISQSYITNPATGTAVASAGVLTFTNGSNIVMSASGSKITITGSGGGSIPSYSAGTFTPGLTVAAGGTPGTITYSLQSGIYTQIGNVVSIEIEMAFYMSGTGGNLVITGLPFTVSNAIPNNIVSGSMQIDTTDNSYGWFSQISSAQSCSTFWANFLGGTTTASLNYYGGPNAAMPLPAAGNNVSWSIAGWYYI
jgi:hypothetical protein